MTTTTTVAGDEDSFLFSYKVRVTISSGVGLLLHIVQGERLSPQLFVSINVLT